MPLREVPVDYENSLLPLIAKIGRGVKFEYIDDTGDLIESEGIIHEVRECGIVIALHNPLHRRGLYGLTFDDGLPKYFPFQGREAIVRIRDKERNIGEQREFYDVFVNIAKNVGPNIEDILNG